MYDRIIKAYQIFCAAESSKRRFTLEHVSTARGCTLQTVQESWPLAILMKAEQLGTIPSVEEGKPEPIVNALSASFLTASSKLTEGRKTLQIKTKGLKNLILP